MSTEYKTANLLAQKMFTDYKSSLSYGCETWTLTMMEERRMRVFENKVFRRIFGLKRDEATGQWRKRHNVELRDLYCSPNIIRVMKSRRIRLEKHVERMEESRSVYWFLVGKPEGKKPLGRPRCRWKYNIKMDLQEVGCGGMDWIWLRIGTGGGHLWVR
jgi:hypothetical protein